jgi:putative SOS response-associated peptidase YedK
MCGRYVSPDTAAIERQWQIGRRNSNPFPRRFNAAPSTDVPLLWREGATLEHYAVRRLVNSPVAEGAELIEPMAA